MPGPLAHEPFSAAEDAYRALVAERRAGRLPTRDFRAAVRALAVRDAEGREWILGPENGSWYRRDRDRWTNIEPPRRLVCPHCRHHNLLRHSFCVECGGRLDRVATVALPDAAPGP